ncbi:MAG: hypothetical protein LBI14_03165 [Treponema sp.]|nr:hypothetical protein [Treponema sp.]
MDYKRAFEGKEEENIFIKTTTASGMGSTDKAALNRKGNILFNSGDIESARRIYLTTGYSDGLIRVGDQYKAQGRIMDALRMYWIAPDRNKAEPIIMQLSTILQKLIHEKDGENE